MGWQATAQMDTFLAIASRREVRDYEPRALPPEVEERILDAGRLSGSAKNRQPWRFDVVRGELLADLVYEPDNLRSSPFVVAVVVSGKGPTSFDAGRAAQSMLLAAWNEGVGGSPNGIAEEEPVRKALGLGENERVAIVLSFGYPAKPRDPSSRSPEEWSARANRKPLDEIVRRLEPYG
jgi:nitroreductase